MLNWLNKKTTNAFSFPFYVSNPYYSNKDTLSSNEIKEKIGEAKHCPPASQEWINSVYSYNKTFTKALPVTDNVVNRLIKSYFSLTPLFKGKKSKRVQIRFRRLSLNRILVSKAEMKHTNNKVIITVYLYNKNKKFLIYKLKNLYKTFILKMPNPIKKETKRNIKSVSGSRINNASTLSNKKDKFNIRKVISSKNEMKNIRNYKSKHSGLIAYPLEKANKISQFNTKNNKFTTKRRALARKPRFDKNNIIKIYNYINSINLTNKRLSKFFVKLRNSNLKNKYKTLMKKYYSIFNKYKLYSLNYNKNYFLNFANLSEKVNKNNFYASQFYNLLKGNINGTLSNSINTLGFNTRRKIKKSRVGFAFKKIKPNKNIKNLMHKVRNFYKLFLLENISSLTNKYKPINTSSIRLGKTNILKNIYKLIKKTNFSKSKKRTNAISLKAVNIIKKARKRKNFILRVLKWNNENFANYEYKYYQNFIKKAYKKEILYMYYIKLLSINNNKFKNWFLLGFKKVVSKLYNKKVEFNFVNLKYLHLNSDIFSESIATKLRNRENRLLTVLKKALRLVKLSSINKGFTNLSPNINKSKKLNMSLFNSVIYNNNDILHQLLHNVFSIQNTEKNNVTTSTSTGTLNNNTNKNLVLDSIKHKAVFGVRLEATGRLSKRLTASRSLFKLKYKGSIKNIDSSFKNLSSVILRGNIRPNIQYTKISSKTRNGSFGLKGWVSGY